MNSVITVLYFNGRVYEDNDGVIFEGSKKAIQIKRGISFNVLKKKIGDKCQENILLCVRHIASNFNRKFNNAKQKEMLKKLGKISYLMVTFILLSFILKIPTLHASTFFYQNLENFRELSPAIATWIDRISKEKWTMAYDREGRRYGHMTMNLSECINKVLKDCRNIPITALVKSTVGVESTLLSVAAKPKDKLRKNQEQACTHIVRVYDIHSTRFEVEESFNPITQCGGQKWAVNLNDHHCQCGRYYALYYPCSHIIAVCGYVSMNYYQYIDVWPLGNEAAIPPSNDAWTLIPDPTTTRAKVDVEPKGITGVAVQCNLSVGVVLPLGHHVAAKGSWSAMKNEAVFPQHHQTNVHLQTYQCHGLQKDTDTSAKDTEQMLVACNTFHGHAAPCVGKNLPLEQSPFVCQNLEFRHLSEACQTVVGEIDALMLDHVPQAQ
ncbi:hypothetical protein GmHk_20G056792 [Glycine max]|nr:hypothetical protein GmHk_20G056792 [Glycine max]